MASHMSTNGSRQTFSIRDLPKSNNFTQKLPSDSQYPTPASSHSAERQKLGPRLVKNAAYTFGRPDPYEKTELVGVSQTALKDVGIDVVISNWRGVFAPPGIRPDAREKLVALMTELHALPAWKEMLKTRDWGDAFLTGEAFWWPSRRSAR